MTISGVLALVALLGTSAFAATVKVEGGQVRGTIEDGLSVYRGIPYAAPPVGDLRWRPPQAAAKWEGVLEAGKFGPPCIQSNAAISNLRAHSEDCLYVNVWTPAKSESEKLAVMFWIHGGGFTAGATGERLYHGEQLAKKGVVVVTIGYRLGALGFLAHPELSAENAHGSSGKSVSGNYGMLDMIAALQWTRKNIGRFGGDPEVSRSSANPQVALR
jgi:para-nitrobenzyl esterase